MLANCLAVLEPQHSDHTFNAWLRPSRLEDAQRRRPGQSQDDHERLVVPTPLPVAGHDDPCDIAAPTEWAAQMVYLEGANEARIGKALYVQPVTVRDRMKRPEWSTAIAELGERQ